MNIRGDLDQQAGQEGILVISHPNNPAHPQSWILRNKSSMQNVVYPGRDKVWIRPGLPLVLKYRMIVYKGQLDKSLLQELNRFH